MNAGGGKADQEMTAFLDWFTLQRNRPGSEGSAVRICGSSQSTPLMTQRPHRALQSRT